METDVYLQAMGITRWVERNDTVANPSAWHDLQQQIATCTRCPLAATRHSTVFGSGPENAEVFIIGEAPGYYEDQQGLPFVGRAGQLLTAMLASIQLRREHVFITNVLKCRPENNRDPLPQEVAACSPYLAQQVAMVQPRLILALGRYAAQTLTGSKSSLKALRQQQTTYRDTGIPLFVSYHPAYLLRNPRDKGEAYQDLLAVARYLST